MEDVEGIVKVGQISGATAGALEFGGGAVAVLASMAGAQAAECRRADFAVAIDPGHTRAVPGASSARGVAERVFGERFGHTHSFCLRHPEACIDHADGLEQPFAQKIAQTLA